MVQRMSTGIDALYDERIRIVDLADTDRLCNTTNLDPYLRCIVRDFSCPLCPLR